MSFIETTTPADARGSVRAMYERQQAKYGYVPNYAKVFSHRPQIMQLWADLLLGIRKNLDDRRFELVTVAAALAIRSSYCSLAHGRQLTRFYTNEEIRAIVDESESGPLTPAELEMMRFARRIARDATSMTLEDTNLLKAHGFTDPEIFDIAAAATARTFFAQLCEGLGAIADVAFRDIEAPLREALTVGRPIDDRKPEQLTRIDAA